MARNYAALPYEYLEEMEQLNDAEFGRLTRALLAYSMTGEPIALCGNERFYAKRVMAQEDRFQESYTEASEKRREAGKKGASQRWDSKNSNAINANSKNGNAILPIASDSKNGYTKTNTETNTNTLPSNDGKSVRARFTPPTLAQVSEYCRERNNGVDPQRFLDYYTANGWKVGKNPMKDWKAAVRTWEKGENHAGKPNTAQSTRFDGLDLYAVEG